MLVCDLREKLMAMSNGKSCKMQVFFGTNISIADWQVEIRQKSLHNTKMTG
jgi:hypothetical protein